MCNIWFRHAHKTHAGILSSILYPHQGPAPASKPALDTDDAQVPAQTVLDMEADRLARLNSSSALVASLPDPPAPRPN